MSPKISFLTIGLAALGLFGSAPSGAADPSVPAPPAASGSLAPARSRAVLLLTNGRILEGQISFDGRIYTLYSSGGRIPYEKRFVEQMFASMEDVYQYKLSLVPAHDTDEQMKLARWCLSQNLKEHAATHLNLVLNLSPQHSQAVAMLESLQAASERAARRDTAVMQASASVERNDPVDPVVMARAMRRLQISGLPQIPGMTTQQAIKRADEFAQLVEPVLQNRCAQCHHESYPGQFRLVRYKNRKDVTADARRANLDVVLALVDQNDPTKSELLASTLRPHGVGANKRPVFTGSNDKYYRVLAAWVNSLRLAEPAREAGGRFVERTPGAPEEFATNRGGQVAVPSFSPTPPSSMSASAALPNGNAPVVRQPGEPPMPGGAATDEFPVPFTVSGTKPKTDPGGGTFSMAPADPSAPPPVKASSLPPLPESIPNGDPLAASANPAGGAKAKPGAVKFDPALLQNALMNRYGAPNPGGR